jgi:hypothetical protein
MSYHSPMAGTEMPVTTAHDVQRSYSIDHIRALLEQASGIAEQEDMVLLAKLLGTVGQLVEKCHA